MGLLHTLKLRFAPPKFEDPDFGPLTYIFVSNKPDRSYWEGKWTFPPTRSEVLVFFPGLETGPRPESRAYYLGLPRRFDTIMAAVTPTLSAVFQRWYNRPIATEVWSDVTLTAFDIDDAGISPTKCDISFETKGDKWLGITIPLIGDAPGIPVVDT
jgi:hypothetical protein